IEEVVNAQLEAEVLIRSSHSSRTSFVVAADLSEMELKKILIEKMEGNKESTILKRRREDDDQKGPFAGLDRGSKRERKEKEHASATTLSEPATGSAGRTTTGSQSRQLSASESAFTEEPVQPTSQMEEPSHPVSETGAGDQPIVQTSQHPEWLGVDTLTPELLAGPTNKLMRGLCISLTELEYHLEEVYKATTDQLDWVNPEGQQYPHNLLQPLPLILDNQGRSEPISYDKHALWGVSHWGRKRQQFYGFVVNRESALGVYSKRRIIAVTELKIMEWHNYKHLDWISKRLNLTKPDTYRSDLKRREAYTAYSNPRGFIYQNKDKKNRLMWIDELHNFSDGALNDVRNALDDRLKGILMQYLPTTIWRRGDKTRAAAMIQAIEKMLKTRRIMRSLERFVGGRQYEGDFRMLQRTI
nr:hypothetical protein [Tanacetum cinerariifolium]